MGTISLHDIAVGICLASTFAFVCFIICLCYVWYKEKKRVHNLPTRPMTLCDTHGAYPTSASVWITVPAEDKKDLKVEMCPQCYDDRLRAAKKRLA